MNISADVVLDSVNPEGKRITTYALTFPRIILPEFNTHRVFSRNARSTRAVPTSRLIEEVRNDPFIPTRFYKNKPGMQGTELMSGTELVHVEAEWMEAAQSAATYAENLFNVHGLHKQHAGRVLEPFSWTFVCLTTTELENFFDLRDDPTAQPEIEDLAKAIKVATEQSAPQQLQWGQFHIPWIRDEEENIGLTLKQKLYISFARSARVSYKTFDNKFSTLEKDLELGQRLQEEKHFSPFEHQAVAMVDRNPNYQALKGNFNGWGQVRKAIEIGAW